MAAGEFSNILYGALRTNVLPTSQTASPMGSTTPSFVGQRIVDTTNKATWEAIGTANTDWVLTSTNKPIVEQTDSYILALTHSQTLQKCNKGSAMNLTVPPNVDVAFPIGTEIDVINYGAGLVTVVAGAGVTVRSVSGNVKLSAQYAAATLKKLAADEWILVGSLSA